MVDTLILVLFVVSGAAAGWLGVDLLPEQQLIRIPNLEQLSWILGGAGGLAGLLAGVVFQRLRRRLMVQRQSYRTRAEALASEKRCAEKLRRRGYWVWQG